jgi:hypothetical protein
LASSLFVFISSVPTQTLWYGKWEPPHGKWNYFEREDDEITKSDLYKEDKETRKRNQNTTSTDISEDWWTEHF